MQVTTIAQTKNWQVCNIVLSFIRLERVRQRQQYQRTEGPASASSGNSVCLFNNYAVLDREKIAFVLDNLIRMVLNGNHGRVDYKRPNNYDDSKKQSIICYFHVYSKVTRDASYAASYAGSTSYRCQT